MAKTNLPAFKNILSREQEPSSPTNQLSEVESQIQNLLNALEDKSRFSSLANFWSKLFFWKKLFGAVFLVGPVLALGLVLHLSIFIVSSGLLLGAYGFASALLVKYGQMSQRLHRLNGLAANLTKLVYVVSNDFSKKMKIFEDKTEHQHQRLNKEITHLKNETERQHKSLHTKIKDLKEQVCYLSDENQKFSVTNHELNGIKISLQVSRENLAHRMIQLEDLINKKSDLLTASQNTQKLMKKQVKKQMEHIKEQEDQLNLFVEEVSTLKTELRELEALIKKMGEENLRSQQITEILQETVSKFSQTVSMDESQKAAFQEKLKTFVEDKEASFHSIAERICESERQLAKTKEELALSNQKFFTLNGCYEKLLARYSSLLTQQNAQLDKQDAQLSLQADQFSQFEAFLEKRLVGSQKDGILRQRQSPQQSQQDSFFAQRSFKVFQGNILAFNGNLKVSTQLLAIENGVNEEPEKAAETSQEVIKSAQI